MLKWVPIATLALAGAACNQSVAQGDANEAATADADVASAALIPDMKGKWTGTSESLVTGASKFHQAPGTENRLLDNVEYSYVIDGQDGRRFWGTMTAPNYKEEVTGVVAKDGKTIVARTSEGEVRGTLVDADTVDLTYSAGGPNMTVVAVNTWKRTR